MCKTDEDVEKTFGAAWDLCHGRQPEAGTRTAGDVSRPRANRCKRCRSRTVVAANVRKGVWKVVGVGCICYVASRNSMALYQDKYQDILLSAPWCLAAHRLQGKRRGDTQRHRGTLAYFCAMFGFSAGSIVLVAIDQCMGLVRPQKTCAFQFECFLLPSKWRYCHL